MKHELGLETRAVHAGQEADSATGAVIVPIYQTSTYAQTEVGVHKGFEYSRTGNPTRLAFEKALASLESGEYGLGFASGMAAIQTLMLTFRSGDHILACDDVYGGTFRLFERVMTRFGLEFTFVDMTDLEATKAAIRPNTKMLWTETPTNPLLKILDLPALAALAHDARALIGVDSTFASPFLQRPLELGADLVMHSTTKYIGGHSDLVGGALVTSNRKLYTKLAYLSNAAGAIAGPFDAWLALRGLKTLGLRMERHCQNAQVVAEFLEQHPRVKRVIYPGLTSHPQHELACRQMCGFGGMISFIVQGGEAEARRVAAGGRIWTLAESLGGVESLIELPAAMTHMSVADSALSVDPGLIRLSVGIESAKDLVADLAQALDPARA